MLIEDAGVRQSLRKIVTRLTTDPALREDLVQECLVQLWRLEREQPRHTRSWYLQNCRFHLQHCLALGRSVDSLKRTDGDKRLAIDGTSAVSLDEHHTNGELFEMVCARDMVSTLAAHLRPCENAVLHGLADGLALGDIAAQLELSYPTALKYRRKIAALTIKLGLPPPSPSAPGRRRRLVRRQPAQQGACILV